MSKRKVAIKMYMGVFLGIILCLILARRFFPFESYGVDDTKILIQSTLNKYINYDLEQKGKGTLVQYEIKTNIEYGKQVIPINQRQTSINFGQIDGQYPNDVKLVKSDIDAEVTSHYDATKGLLVIQPKSQKTNEEYLVIANYDTYTNEKIQRELELNVKTTVNLQDDTNRQINNEEIYHNQVVEDIGELTSLKSETQDIYNGYLKSNSINGTNYDTLYEQSNQIIISKKEAQDNIEIFENNTFVKIHTTTKDEKIVKDIGNNQNLTYQSTQIKKAELEQLLGKEGKLEILDLQDNIIATIDETTEVEQNGIITICYEKQLEAIKLRTSSILKEGILHLEHIKKIKSTWTDLKNVGVKTTIEMNSKSNVQEIVSELKEAETTIHTDISNHKWSNNRQNEVTFDIQLNANTPKNDLFKNPSLRIEFPKQVEKVILEDSSIFYANGLELINPYIDTNENGNLVMTVNLQGEQTQYDENSLALITNVKIVANVILSKEIQDTTQAINVSFTNGYTIDGSLQTGNQQLSIEIENYQEENLETTLEENELYSLSETVSEDSNVAPNIHAQDLKLQVAPTKGGTTLKEGDTVYEGEYIKYNVRIENTSNEDISDVTVRASIPKGVIYGELEADYNHYLGKYQYNFQENLEQKQIELGTIKAGEQIDTFYEVKVNDLLEGQANETIKSSIDVLVGENVAQNYSITNKVEPSEVQLFMGATLDYGGWSYYLNLKSKTNQEIPVDLHLLEAFKIESVSYLNHTIDSYTSSVPIEGDPAQIVYTDYDNYEGEQIRELDLQFSDNHTVMAQLKTNSCYVFQGKFDNTKINKKPNQSTVELMAYVETKLNDKFYHSNETRIELSYQNVKVSMSSPNEGEKVKYKEKIEYEIAIENIGRNNVVEENHPQYVSVKVSDFLPEELDPILVSYDNWEIEVSENKNILQKKKVTKDISNRSTDQNGNKLPDVRDYILIPQGETAILKIEAQAGLVFKETKIENSASVSGDNIDLKTTNVISHTILSNNYSEEDPNEPNKPDEPNNPNNPEIPSEPNDPNNPINPNNRYNIEGIAWIDENGDGKRDAQENVLSGMTIMLIDMANSNTIKSITKTNSNGNYQFSELEQGNYLVTFLYDINTYKLTQYQKAGVSSLVNSDAIERTITLSGEKVDVGVTDVIHLNQSVTNIDIGLIENKICDFKIDKYINKVTVKTASSNKEYNYDNKKLVKTEIKAKEIEGATVTVQYKIIVTNVGEIAGSISQIVDYLPEGFSFSSTQNSSWSKSKKGELINTSIANRNIKAGESLELTLIITKQMTANSTGTFTNKVDLIDEKDSILENNSNHADIIISVSTGAIVFISITILILVVLSFIAIYLWKKGKINIKNFSKITFIFTFMVILVISLNDYTSIAIEAPPKLVLHADQTAISIGFYNSNHDLIAHCTGGTLAPANSVEKTVDDKGVIHYGNATYNFWEFEPSPDHPRTRVEPPISYGNFTLQQKNTDVKMEELNDEYNLYGPIQYNSTATDGKYTCIVKDETGKDIKDFTICDETGKNKVTLKGGSITFYIKISKDKCKNGIGSIQLSATATVKDIYKWREGFLAKYIPEGWKNCQNIKLVEPIYEEGEEEVFVEKTNTITWTDIKSGIVIFKVDEESDKKLPDVTFNVTCSTVNFDKDYQTNDDGEIVIKNLSKGNYKIKEKSNDNYGYTEKMDDKIIKVNKGGTIFSETLENEKQTGNLRIKKVDGNTNVAMKDVEFKIKNSDGKYIRIKDKKQEIVSTVTGRVYVGGIATTTDKTKATKFITNTNGYIDIYNILADTYTVIETSVGTVNANQGYELDDNYISWSSNEGKGEGKVSSVTVDRRSSLKTLMPSNGVSIEANVLTVKNRKKYFNISGYVWEDIGWQQGKDTQKNGLYKNDNNDVNDKLVQGVTVELKNTRGEVIKSAVTGTDGKYKFTKVTINDLTNYYIEFQYNGMGYKNVDFKSNYANGSKAIEGGNRTTFNNAYTTITQGKSNAYNLNYETTPYESKLLYGNKANYNYGYLENNANDPISGVDTQYIIKASTYSAYGGNLDKIISIEDIRKDNITELGDINLGIEKRDKMDISLEKDVHSVKVNINRRDYVYRYADRLNNPQMGSNDNPQVKYQTELANKPYTRALYASDIYYTAEGNQDNRLKVQVTYQILVKTNNPNIKTMVNELTDYYDEKYQNIKVGKEINADGSIKGNTCQVTPLGTENGYTKVKVNTDIEATTAGSSIYVQLEVKPDKIVEIVGIKKQKLKLDNIVEVSSYSSKDKNGNIYAAIDKDSQPGNVKIGSTYEDDTAKAPGLLLMLQEERQITGIVFEDETGQPNLKTGQTRQGNGIYDAKEKGIKDVSVKLVKATTQEDTIGETAKEYLENERTREIKTTTNEKGEFSLQGFIPDEYQVVFTWGDKNHKVQEYKSTIVNKQSYESNLNNKEWYKNNKETRVSDAVDIYQQRETIDNQASIMTYANKNVINQYSGQLEQENGSKETIITKIDAKTPRFQVNIEYEPSINAKEEYALDRNNEIIMNGVYAVKNEKYKNHLKNIDFGIVERARQQLELEKDVKNAKIILANGNVLIDAEIQDGKIVTQAKHTIYVPKSSVNGQIKFEVDTELLQSAQLQIDYKIKIINSSELDYKNKEYYNYGKGYGQIERDLIGLSTTKVIDYLDNNIAVGTKEQLGTIIQEREKKNQLMTQEGLLIQNSGMRKFLLEDTQKILIIDKLNQEIKPQGIYTTTEKILETGRLLSNITLDQEITIDNSAEIIKIKKTGGSPIVTMPGNYVPSDANSSEVDDDLAENITVVPPTGQNRNYLAYGLLISSSLGILIAGIVLIKKLVLR